MVVVAPIGTKPVAGGSNNTVPASTRSGFLILFSATRAGALIFSLSAMAYNDSPGRIGGWLGWQIVRSYMKNNNVTLPELLKTEAKVL